MRYVPGSSGFAPLVAALAALSVASCGDRQPQERLAPPGPPPTPTLEQVRSAALTAQPGVVLWEPTFHTADLDGIIGNEAVVMLSSTGGGSGEFVHIAVYGMRDGALASLAMLPVGDRTRLQSLWVERGKVVMDVIEVGPQDAACCGTQVARKTFGFEGGTFKQLASEVRGMLALSMLSANEWTLIEIDGQPLPADVEPPLIHVESDRIRGFAGCNRFTASVAESKPGEIEIGAAAAEKKACPAPQMELEQRFLAQLDTVNRYGYVAGQLALTWADGERVGTLLFRK